MSEPRPATTILILREADTRSGMEVFMLQRHRRSGFLPNAWVFPGGRVEPGDAIHDSPRVTGGEALIGKMGLERETAIAYLVAGVRETFEESGIWLGTGALPDDQRDPLNDGDVKLSDLLATHDATVDLDQVYLWSWWITPAAEPRRYDTRFLLAVADVEGRHDERETVDSRWICPAWALEHGRLDDFPVAPPTWWTLFELARLGGLAAVVHDAQTRPHRPIEPIMRFADDGMELLLPGHPEHPEPPFPGLPHEVRFEDRMWVAVQDGEVIAMPG